MSIVEILTWVLAGVVALVLVWFALRIVLRLAIKFVACAVAVILLAGLVYLVITYLS